MECRIYEAAPELRPLGVGINLLPHATAVLGGLDVMDGLTAIAVETEESIFFNRFGQKIFSEPAGRRAGYQWPQLSIHRGELQLHLADVVRQRLGADAIVLDHQATGVEQDENGVTVRFRSIRTGRTQESITSDIAVSAEGVHSSVRKQFYPDEGRPEVLRRGDVARHHGGAAVPHRRQHGAGRLADGRQDGHLPDQERRRRHRQSAGELGRRAGGPVHRRPRLGKAGRPGRFHARVRGLALRLAGRTRAAARRRVGAGVPHGRPGPVAAVDLRSGHPAR